MRKLLGWPILLKFECCNEQAIDLMNQLRIYSLMSTFQTQFQSPGSAFQLDTGVSTYHSLHVTEGCSASSFFCYYTIRRNPSHHFIIDKSSLKDLGAEVSQVYRLAASLLLPFASFHFGVWRRTQAFVLVASANSAQMASLATPVNHTSNMSSCHTLFQSITLPRALLLQDISLLPLILVDSFADGLPFFHCSCSQHISMIPVRKHTKAECSDVCFVMYFRP